METDSNLFMSLIILMLYFVPSVMAYVRKHSKRSAILVLNIFLGWTFLGWIIALIWAYTEKNMDNAKNSDTKKCPFCAENIKKEAIVCKFCGGKLEKE